MLKSGEKNTMIVKSGKPFVREGNEHHAIAIGEGGVAIPPGPNGEFTTKPFQDFFDLFDVDRPLAWARLADSPGQLAEKLIPYLKGTSNGFFIEAGANNGVFQSNTIFLEECFNWTGILVEPNLRAFELCKKMRLRSKVINCALVDSEDIKEVEGYFCDINSDLSLTGKISSSEDEDNKRKKTKVKASTLNRILKDNDIENNIDFLSLDTEGYELNILNGLDFNRWAPKLICVESYDPKKFFKIKQKLASHGYAFIARLTKGDFLFKHISSNN